MTKYDVINDKTNLRVIVQLIRNGFMKPDIVRNINIYDKFVAMEGSKMQRYKTLAEEYKMKPITIQLIINNLNKKAK